MVANAILFLAAGYETTGSLLTYLTYALAINSEVQERLYQDTKEVFDADGNVNYDRLVKNTYLDAFVCETIRMYAPIVRVERVANKEYFLGDQKIRIAKDMMVLIPVYAIHHQEKFYP